VDLLKMRTDLDWKHWVDRWDRMQQRYLSRRSERFDIMINLIRSTQHNVSHIIDLGCGTGSVSLMALKAFPDSTLTGIDFDPSMLLLAQERLKPFGNRANVELTNLRDPKWLASVSSPVDAVVSATALHWLSPQQLAILYEQIATVMKPGGMFLNADHVGSQCTSIQTAWEAEKAETREQEGFGNNEDWDSFWTKYAEALQIDINELHSGIVGGWESGTDEGLPLSWHIDTLRDCGFSHVDCFWRCNCDAVYGGIRE
jgi:trans-aconitate methyltransferase